MKLNKSDFFFREIPNIIQILGLPLIISSYLFGDIIVFIIFYLTIGLLRGYLESKKKSYKFDQKDSETINYIIDGVIIATWTLGLGYVVIKIGIL